MPEQLVLVDGSTFFASERTGDPDGAASGLFFADTRHLSQLRLTVDGEPMRVLTCDTPFYYAARITGTLAGVRVGSNPTVSLRRDRLLADGVHEDVTVENHSSEPRQVQVRLEYAADFADLFEVKSGDVRQREVSVDVGADEVVHRYSAAADPERSSGDGFSRATRMHFSMPGDITASDATWTLDLDPREEWSLCIHITCIEDDREVVMRAGHGGIGELQPQMPETLEEWEAAAPALETGIDAVSHGYRQALLDLAALRFRPFDAQSWSIPAGGMPWFMALFGRDSILTAYQALPFAPQLARTTLQALASLQATADDPYRDAEPGKILHELRRGEAASVGARPNPYYGGHDTTLLFLVLLDEYERWTGDADLVRSLQPAARAAVAWMEGPADRDGDGYLEYEMRSPDGLPNQCWKDSDNSMLFADGRRAGGPIATCEIQGYAFDARRRTARLARAFWGDDELADRLEGDADALRDRFVRDFWSEELGGFVLALDGEKRQVDSVASNMGHLLWSGILTGRYATATAERLLRPDLASGWGIRTMSTGNGGFNPIEYHNGAVWPHDTGLIAEGLRRYGYVDQARDLAMGLFDAAADFGYQLPEVFAGFPREPHSSPVEYPTASRPQAWASGSLLLALRTLLGMDVEVGDGSLSSRPLVPGCRLDGVAVRGRRETVGG